MDTRDSTKLGPGGTRDLVVAGGTSGVPAGATAVALNVTVTGTTAASFLTVYPTGATRPLASNLNWTAGKTIANLVEVPVGSGGQVTFYNGAGSTHVIADLEGYFLAPSGTFGQHVALTPARIADSRTGSGKPLAGLHFGPGVTRDVQVAGAGGVPPDTSGTSGTPAPVSGVILNVTATHTTAASFLTVWPSGATRPTASNLNWTAGQTIPNRVFVPLGAGFTPGAGKVSVYNASGTTDVIVDVSGYFTDGTASGAEFTPQSPFRLADTRSSSPIGAGGTMTLQVGGVAGVPTDASAVILNVTATHTTATSFLTVYPATASRPLASDLNWTAGLTIPNLTVARLGSNGAIKFFNAAGKADVVVDIFGYFRVPAAPPPAPSLVSATINVGTKTITATWSQVVDCPAGSAGNFTFADQYPGPGKAASSTAPVTASAVVSVGTTGSIYCTVTFGSEPRNFGPNDTGNFHYQQPGSPTIVNAVNNANGFAPSATLFASDVSAPHLRGASIVAGTNTFMVIYDEPISCSGGSVPGPSRYTATLNGGADTVTGTACEGGFLSQTDTIIVTVATGSTTTSDAWTLTSSNVFDFQGNFEPNPETKSGFAAADRLHLTAIAATYTSTSGGTGTITLTLSSNVDCASVQSDASEFTVVDTTIGAGSVTLDSRASCTGNTIVYNYTAGNGGVIGGDSLTATAQFGSNDGNTVINSAGTQTEANGDAVTGTV